jgi:hypothetical protein
LTPAPPRFTCFAMELGWWKRNEEGKKYQVNVRVYGKELRWTCQRARFEPWEPYGPPTEEDWDMALDLVEKRYVRRLVREDVVKLVRERRIK